MKFFPQVMRALASALGAAAVIFGRNLVALFSGPAPSDVSVMVWGIVGFVAVFLINYAVGKIPAPKP